MKTIYTIPAKKSNSGSIHDIAAEYDRDIVFQKNCKYAVVLASYYGGKGYTTHATDRATIKQSNKLKRDNYSFKIIGQYGEEYEEYSEHLRKIS